jgi:hypothetical protein
MSDPARSCGLLLGQFPGQPTPRLRHRLVEAPRIRHYTRGTEGSHPLEDGDIAILRGLPGRNDVRTTMVSMRVFRPSRCGAHSPFGGFRQSFAIRSKPIVGTDRSA